MPEVVFTFEVEAKGEASSVFTLETIDARLDAIADDVGKAEERDYLNALRAREFPSAPVRLR